MSLRCLLVADEQGRGTPACCWVSGLLLVLCRCWAGARVFPVPFLYVQKCYLQLNNESVSGKYYEGTE